MKTMPAYYTATTGAKTRGNQVRPFLPLEVLNQMISDLNTTGSDDSCRRLRDALQGNITTTTGQKALLEVAVERAWFLKDAPKPADEDGIEGYHRFRQDFSSELKFFGTAVDGNHRWVSGLGTLMRTKASRDTPLTPSSEGDENFLSDEYLGRDENTGERCQSLVGLAIQDLVNSNRTSQLNLPLEVDLIAARKDVDEESGEYSAQKLLQDLLVSASKAHAEGKQDSSRSNGFSRLAKSLHHFKPNPTGRVPSQTGMLLITQGARGDLIENPRFDAPTQEERRNFDLKTNPFTTHGVIARYMNNPEANIFETLRKLRLEVDNSIRFPFPATLTKENIVSGVPKGSDSLLYHYNRVIGILLLKVLSKEILGEPFDKDMIAAIVEGGLFAEKPFHSVKMNDKTRADLGNIVTPQPFGDDQTSHVLTLTLLFCDMLSVSNLYKVDELFNAVLDKLALEIGTEQGAMFSRLGKFLRTIYLCSTDTFISHLDLFFSKHFLSVFLLYDYTLQQLHD